MTKEEIQAALRGIIDAMNTFDQITEGVHDVYVAGMRSANEILREKLERLL